MTGVDLARAIKEKWPDIPVLIVSGYAEAEGVAPDLPRLTKPFRQPELAASIANSIAGRKPIADTMRSPSPSRSAGDV